MATKLETYLGMAHSVGPAQVTTVPSAFSAEQADAEIAMTFVKPDGGFEPLPQATTVPSFRKAKLKRFPAATAMTFDKPGGGLAWPELPNPQPTIVPSNLKARQ